MNQTRARGLPISVLGPVLWFLDGASLGFGLAAILTIGLLLLAFGVVGAVLLGRSAAFRRYWPAVVGGPAPALAFLAYLNRSGPGTVCTATATSSGCVQEYSPWPFLGLAVFLLIGAAVAQYLVANGPRHG
ncbi:hypothetical protein KGA66_17400 [Actinocrinis puniceicyclus]|uniref:Uncharacterized protein n=1 Tax=Actinocrinis puniceicyclus TaxID=977794 RepID=A0A8J8BC78_9ACTN|nr:hypothetical protein [Actinocrinis puniceicyclus]MBS2964837.1 hypothetical protein [Actinocrinis puniceicyclus]